MKEFYNTSSVLAPRSMSLVSVEFLGKARGFDFSRWVM